MRRIFSDLWDSAFSPILFGMVGALLLVGAEQTLLPIFIRIPESPPVNPGVDFTVAIVGFCIGLAIWHRRQS